MTLYDWTSVLRECHRHEFCREQLRRFDKRVLPPIMLLSGILTANFYLLSGWLVLEASGGLRSLFRKIAALLLDRPISCHSFERLLILLIFLSAALLWKLAKSAHICRDCVVAKEVSKQYLWHLRDRGYRISCDWTIFVLSEWPEIRQRVQKALSGRWEESFIERQLESMILKPSDLLAKVDREGLDVDRRRLVLMTPPDDEP